MTPPELAAQVERYLDSDRNGAAELLAKRLRERDRTLGDRVLAVTYFRLSRWESLRNLLAEAERDGRLDDKLREIRLAARVGLGTQEMLGAERHPLVEGDMLTEVRAQRPKTLLVRGETLMLLLARRVGLAKGAVPSKTALEDADREIVAEVGSLLDAEGKDPDALRLALVSMVAIEKTREGLALVSRKVAKLPAKARESVDMLLARVDLGDAVRNADVSAVERALSAVDAKIKQLENRAYSEGAPLVLFSVIGHLSASTFGGKALTPAELASARTNLERIAWAFDTSTDPGLELEQMRTLTLGTLAFLARDPSAASHYFRLARSLRANPFGNFAGAMASLLVDDGVGAFDQCQRIPPDERAEFAQLAAACRATAIIRGGGDPTAALKEVLALWGDAQVPEVIGGRVLRPIFTGIFNVGLSVSPSEPMVLVIEPRPLLVLLPELVTDRATIEERLR